HSKNYGFAGYNSAWFLKHITPNILVNSKKDIVLICLGANDSVLPSNPRKYSYQHIPVIEYGKNLKSIIEHFLQQGIDPNNIILIAPPYSDPEKAQKYKLEQQGISEPLRRDNKFIELYIQEMSKISKEKMVAFVRPSKISSEHLFDGLHLNA